MAQRRTPFNCLGAFAQKIEDLNRGLNVMSLRQQATADFRSAIDVERLLLDYLIDKVESDQRIESMSAETREFFEKAKVKLELHGVKQESISEICRWKKIVKPEAIDDMEVQRQIEADYASAMEERNKRISNIGARCAKDPKFARDFSRKLAEAKYPIEDSIRIVPMLKFIEYTEGPNGGIPRPRK